MPEPAVPASPAASDVAEAIETTSEAIQLSPYFASIVAASQAAVAASAAEEKPSTVRHTSIAEPDCAA